MYDVYVKVLLYKGLISDSKSDNYISKFISDKMGSAFYCIFGVDYGCNFKDSIVK